jgi:hypothetical protein
LTWWKVMSLYFISLCVMGASWKAETCVTHFCITRVSAYQKKGRTK